MSKPEGQLPPWWKAPGKGPLPAPAVPPAPMDTAAVQAEMAAWLKRGGSMSPEQAKVGGGVPMPGGIYGGEFSDEDMAAFQDAQHKLEAAKSEQRLAPLLSKLRALPMAKPDATRTK